MYCPSCRFPNLPKVEQCEHCQADLGDLRERVALGNQFVFADASGRRKIALSLDGLQPDVFAEPTVVSRHLHSIGLGENYVRPGYLTDSALRPKPSRDLPKLPPPQLPNLTAVVTERKIYRPKEEAHIFIVAPDAPGQEVELEVQLAGQQITKERVTLDEAGLGFETYADLEEGEYAVLVHRLREGKAVDQGKPAQCTFSVAEFSLSPLVALLVHHTYDAGELAFRLRVIALSVAYSGPAVLGLHCTAAGRVVETAKTRVRDGLVDATFDVSEYEGPFHVQVTTPDGETASVFFPGTGKTERERIVLCPLGRVAEASLLPGEDTEEAQGLHVGYDGFETTPVRLESAVARTGTLVAGVPAAAVQVVTFHPLTGRTAAHDFRSVKVGDELEFPVYAPYTLFSIGFLAPRQPYEAWGVVVRPHELDASLQAPEVAEPGDEIAVRIEADRPASCLLLVYDARLEHESPIPKLGKQLMEAIRGGARGLKEQAAPPLASLRPFAWDPRWKILRAGAVLGAGPEPRALRSKPRRAIAMMSPPPVATPAIEAFGRPVASAAHPSAGVTEVDIRPPLTLVPVPNREDFPELAYMELLSVDGIAERTVPLGDQIGTWRCRAYFVSGLDVVERTANVEAAKAVYAELDLPAIVGQGDDILASVRYHTEQPATLSIELPGGPAGGGRTISGVVVGHGSETFHLTDPGDVTVHIASPDGDDWTTRTVKPPGVQTVTVSRLDILERGETVRAKRVVVYPGPTDVLTETIEALGRYPFG